MQCAFRGHNYKCRFLCCPHFNKKMESSEGNELWRDSRDGSVSIERQTGMGWELFFEMLMDI